MTWTFRGGGTRRRRGRDVDLSEEPGRGDAAATQVKFAAPKPPLDGSDGWAKLWAGDELWDDVPLRKVEDHDAWRAARSLRGYVLGRITATPRVPRGCSAETNRDDAAAATWIFLR